MTAYLVAMGSIGLFYGLLTLGLNLQWGFTGLINFGQVAFYALGAYTSALVAMHTGWPLPVTIALGAAVAGLAAFPLGAVSLRLKEDYLAIVTLGFAEVVRLVLLNESWLTRGASGITDIPPLFRTLAPRHRDLAFFALLVGVTVLVYLFLRRLTAAPFGRVLRAIKADELATRALAKPTGAFKTWSLVLGAACAGLAGALYAHYMRYVVPDQFTAEVTFYVWIGLILGGSGRHAGALVGPFLLMAFLEGTRFLKDFWPALDPAKVAAVRMMTIGLALVLLVLFRPDGVLGKRPTTAAR